MKKKILFVIHLDTFFKILEPYLSVIPKKNDYEPLVFFASDYDNRGKDEEWCKTNDIRIIYSYGKPLQDFTKHNDHDLTIPNIFIRESIKEKTPPIFYIYQIKRFFDNIIKYRKKTAEVKKILEKQGIDIIVLAGDIVHYDSSIFIKTAHNLKIPSVIIAGFVSGPHEHWDVFRYNPEYQWTRLSNRFFCSLFPQWMYEEEGIRLARLPIEQALPREILGIAPPQPWVVHSGYWDLMLVESQYAKDYCIKNGFDPEKVVVTGSLMHDKITDINNNRAENKRKLCVELSLDDSMPIIFVGLNQLDFSMHNGMLPLSFQTNIEYTEFLIKSLKAIPGYSVIISLHPSMVYEDHKYIEEWGVKISHWRTFEVMPLCDIYIANISSTINWAIACGKPVISYDVCLSRSPDWDMAKAVFHVESKKDFLDILNKLSLDHDYYYDTCLKQTESASYWGVLDGKAGERVIMNINEIISSREKSQ